VTEKAFADERNLRRRQRSEFEILSAMRDVSHVVNEQTSREDMLSAVARILDSFLNDMEESIRAEEITIFARPEQAGETEPVAVLHKEGDTIAFLGQIQRKLDTLKASQCMVTRVALQDLDGETLTSCVPLAAEGDVIGVLQMTTALTGSREQRAHVAEKLKTSLVDIGKHVGLALKTLILARTARRDTLTGLLNRGGFQRDIDVNFDRAKKNRQQFGLVMIDIDHFKAVNDTHGHLAGDIVLAGVACLVNESLRRYDAAYRYGGEEIAVLTTRSGLRGATVLAKRLRAKVERERFLIGKNERIRVTISLGVAELGPSMDSPEELIAAADRALYAAKAGGRNQVKIIKAEEGRPVSP